MATYKRYKNKFKNLKKQIDDLNNSGNSISTINNLDKTFLKNDVLFRQTLDPKIESLKTSFKNLKKTIKDYFIKFSDEDSFCYSNNPQESLSSFNGNEYMYFSTAYAKIFLNWNQFDKLLPTAKEEKYFFEKKWNKYVRIVPIDYTILESHGRQAFKKILRKLDGIVLTGGNASFYEDIEPSGLNQKNFTKNMTYPELVQAYLKQLENKIEVSDGIKLKKIKTTYLQGISDVVNIVKEINQDKDKRLHIISNQHQYHDLYMSKQNQSNLLDNSFSTFSNFLQTYYKNSIYFPNKEEKCFYFNHTKEMSKSQFLMDQNLTKEFGIVAVSYVDKPKKKMRFHI